MRRFPIIAALALALPLAAQAQDGAMVAADGQAAAAAAEAPVKSKPRSQNRFGQAIAELARVAREQRDAERAESTPGDTSVATRTAAPGGRAAPITASLKDGGH